MRYGQSFSYHVTVPAAGPYTVLLNFVEPTVTGAGQRVFSVWANDQPIIENLDLFAEAGLLVPTARSYVIATPGTDLSLRFAATVRNAVISAITVTPCWQFMDGEIPTLLSPGVYTLANPPSPPTSLHLHRNGLRQQVGFDYTLAGNVITFLPASAPMTGDTLLADYRR